VLLNAHNSTVTQVHNALGYAYFNMGKTDIAIGEYKQAVEKQPG
jgi:Flp pilus assembly protein TadD